LTAGYSEGSLDGAGAVGRRRSCGHQEVLQLLQKRVMTIIGVHSLTGLGTPSSVGVASGCGVWAACPQFHHLSPGSSCRSALEL